MTQVRMWADVPTDERASDADLLAAWVGLSPHYRDRERARLVNPGPCRAAVTRAGWLRGKWLPCGAPTAPGADLCAMHGGPTKPKKRAKWLDLAERIWDSAYEAGLAGEPDENPYREGRR